MKVVYAIYADTAINMYYLIIFFLKKVSIQKKVKNTVINQSHFEWNTIVSGSDELHLGHNDMPLRSTW